MKFKPTAYFQSRNFLVYLLRDRAEVEAGIAGGGSNGSGDTSPPAGEKTVCMLQVAGGVTLLERTAAPRGPPALQP